MAAVKRNSKLVSSVVVQLALVMLASNNAVHSIIVPPKFYTPNLDPPKVGHLSSDLIEKGVNESPDNYVLSINEGDTLDVDIHSQASLTVNLNRAIAQDVDVTVSVYSGIGLVSFLNSSAGNGPLQSNNHSSTIISAYNITYKANTFGDRTIKFETNKGAGRAEIICKVAEQPSNLTIDDSLAYISVNISRYWKLNYLIQTVGWIYFFAWSASFYFQVILNYKRKSVVGLNFDFLALNLFGFTCYSIYNFTFLFSDAVRRDYYKLHTYSRIPVEYNDLFFALHAFLLTLITVMQCFIYQRGQQQVSKSVGLFVFLCSMLGIGLYVAQIAGGVTILSVVLYLSYVKLVITIIKYTPQAFMNYRRRATTGWSIHNILLDFTGGLFSLAQMFLIAYNYDDWVSIFGNFTKFGLGVISMTFDILFVLQHYVLYKNPEDSRDHLEDSTESVPSPVISQSIRSGATVQQSGQQVDNDAETTTENENIERED